MADFMCVATWMGGVYEAFVIDWFNHRWLLEAIGNVPPAELEMA